MSDVSIRRITHDTALFSLENYFLNTDINAFLFYLDK